LDVDHQAGSEDRVWALSGSTTEVAGAVSVRVGARARSDPTQPADVPWGLS
jgi:hypothetical protein